MPSVLAYLNYDQPFVAFGHDVLTRENKNEYVVNYNNPLYQILQGDYMLQWDGEKTVALYNVRTDPMLKANLKGTLPDVQSRMETEIMAQIQQYMMRMVDDRLCIETDLTNRKED